MRSARAARETGWSGPMGEGGVEVRGATGVVGVECRACEIAEPFFGRPISVATVRLSRAGPFHHACHATVLCLALISHNR
jgi:hypothetical protein